MKVVSYDDSSITCEIPGMGTLVGPESIPTGISLCSRHARESSTIASGSAFPMVIKLAGGVPTIDAFGIYLTKGGRAFGTVPPDVYKKYLREARNDSETTLRLEINSRQYERVLKIIKEWERRDREGALLYTTGRRDPG